MLTRICHDLFPLASLAEQESYLVQAKVEKYLLPEELLDVASHIVASVEEDAIWVRGISEQAKTTILKFGGILRLESEQIELDKLAWSDLVYHCPEWAAIRLAAYDCLSSLGCKEAT